MMVVATAAIQTRRSSLGFSLDRSRRDLLAPVISLNEVQAPDNRMRLLNVTATISSRVAECM